MFVQFESAKGRLLQVRSEAVDYIDEIGGSALLHLRGGQRLQVKESAAEAAKRLKTKK